LLKTFSNVWELKYGNIGFVAGLVFDLQRYHPEFGVSVLDQTMENIRIGMEVRYMSYLKEMLMNRKTSSSLIKDVLLVLNTLENCTCTEQSVLLSSLILSGL